MQKVNETLWMGNARDARSLTQLYEIGIEAIVDLAYEERPAELPRELIYCRIPLIDGQGNPAWKLRLAIDSLDELISAGAKTLVSCSAGLSRTPAIVAASLSQHQHTTLNEALASLADFGRLDVSPGLIQEISQAL
jgi:protein-tyrosine phosphatase